MSEINDSLYSKEKTRSQISLQGTLSQSRYKEDQGQAAKVTEN